MKKDALACGISTELNKKISKAFAIFAIKKKKKNNQESRKIYTLINCLIAKDHVNKKS